MAGLSTVLGIYTYFTNTHDHARSGLPYQKIRSKPYPWACSDCALFDGDCWKECRGETVSHDEHH